jgi:hypothetical protein
MQATVLTDRHRTVVSRTQALDERRLALEVDSRGRILSVTSGTPATLFGVATASLLGARLFGLLDFMQLDSAWCWRGSCVVLGYRAVDPILYITPMVAVACSNLQLCSLLPADHSLYLVVNVV